MSCMPRSCLVWLAAIRRLLRPGFLGPNRCFLAKCGPHLHTSLVNVSIAAQTYPSKCHNPLHLGADVGVRGFGVELASRRQCVVPCWSPEHALQRGQRGKGGPGGRCSGPCGARGVLPRGQGGPGGCRCGVKGGLGGAAAGPLGARGVLRPSQGGAGGPGGAARTAAAPRVCPGSGGLSICSCAHHCSLFRPTLLHCDRLSTCQ